MRRNLRFIIERLYLGMLSLYPDRFRANFGEELQDIFLRIVDEAEGNNKLLAIYFNEFKSLTISIVRERWHEYRSRKKMTPDSGGVFQNGRALLTIVEIPDRSWIWRWTLLTTAAYPAGWILKAPITALLLYLHALGTRNGIVSNLNGDTLQLVGFFCGIALSYATSQWLMLRKYLPLAKSWFLATGIGLLVAGILLGIFITVWDDTFIPFGSAVFFLLIGTVVGIAQWVVLRKVLQNAIWILVIDILAAGSYLLGGRSISSYLELIIILVLPGLFTGVGIWMLLKQSQHAVAEEEREINRAKKKQRTPKRIWVLAGLASLIPLFFAFGWFHATSQIELAKSRGIYATVEEAVIAINSQGWGGAQVVKIEDVHIAQNWDGGQPHVWFGSCWVYLDRVPKGWDRTQYSSGSYYIHVKEGWVLVPEGAFPEFIGWVMELYDLEGVNEWIKENKV
jgi:hypothetical protein